MLNFLLRLTRLRFSPFLFVSAKTLGSVCSSIGMLLFISCGASAQNSYYVSSQNGNDSWSGLLPAPNSAHSDGPFQSLAKAQAQMQGSSIKTVSLRAGTYSIASNLVLNPIDSGESWTASAGESPILDGGGSGRPILNNPHNVSFQGLTFQGMGAGGFYINFGQVISIKGNHFNNCNQNCINGSGVVNSVIESNIINGQSPGNGANISIAYSAITLGYGSSNNQLSHNLIENCQGGGIGIWTGRYDPPSNNNIVDRNIFQNVATNVVDMGAIYMYDTSHAAVGNQITNNIVNGDGGNGYQTNGTKAFYVDDLASNILISGNICRNCGSFAWQIHAGDHITIVNNVFDLSSPGTPLGLYQTENSNYSTRSFGMTGNTFQRNIVYFSGSAPSTLYFVGVLPSDALPADQNNLYYSANGSKIPNGSSIVDSSPVYANPEFADPSNGNYSMPSSSAAFRIIGFQPLATDQGPVGSGQTSPPPPNPGSGGSLTGSVNSATTTADLTGEGRTDWAHWGTALTRKSGVTPQIGPWSIVGSGTAVYYYINDPRAVHFSDGTGPVSATVTDGIYINGQNGFSFRVPAGTGTQTLTVHVGGFRSSGTLTAHLSDGSAADFVDTTSLGDGQYDRNYTLTYQAASGGQNLTVTWRCNTSTGNVTLNGAALH